MSHEAIIEAILERIIKDSSITSKDQLYRITNEIAAITQSPTTPPLFQVLAGYRARLTRT